MPLIPTKYLAKCEVLGCNKQIEGTPQQLSSSSWSMRMLMGGVPNLEPLGTFINSQRVSYPGNIVCPNCKAMGYYKEMRKPL